jgi:hypothetical protein
MDPLHKDSPDSIVVKSPISPYIYIYMASGPVAIMPPRTKAGDPEPSAKKTLTGWHVLAGSPNKEF